ncbi:hypothetical protein [Segnochrobactrum spirostomi]|uniref:Glutamine amidotransferase domain-containing protein n=1 Tax=Segnochrobactrum spirostomi TaxID=2608987 RepID=A0A6A7Y0R2_9HYPH|nr:hypothetical protein [Segnochrobactrum spirostomi]MQT12534.1 hypothetical protein [Segnochrobactrum spirostomi]
MNWSLAASPLLPIALISAFAVVGLALSVAGLVRRVRGAWLRLAAVAALLAALLNPALVEEKRSPLTSVAALVIDRSQSQDLGDRTAATEAARKALLDTLGSLKDVEVREIDVAPAAGADGTRLFSALSSGLADVPPDRVAGAILVTDGQVHDVPASAAALGFDAPVHALVTGRPDEIDRRLVLERAPRFGLVGTTQSVRLRVEDEGRKDAGGTVKLTARRDGETIADQEVPIGQPFDLPIEIAHGGQNIFEFEVAPLAGELTAANNTAVAIVDGVRENLRVLLVSGEPHAGERTWRNLLKSDASVDLVHFTILRPPEKQDGTPINELSLIAFPTRELFATKINQFDLIIFDRYHQRGILPLVYFDNIAQFVRGGGAVLVSEGPPQDPANFDGQSLFDTPLSSVLPAEPTGRVIEEPFRPELTDMGKRHPVTRDLPGSEQTPPAWSHWFRMIDANASSGQTVMSGAEGRPLLILGREGKGRSATLLSDHAWLWARGYEGGGPHVPLLRRLAHWLMKEPELEEEALRLSVRGTNLVIERQTLGDTVAPVTLTDPTGRKSEVTLKQSAPGLWTATVPATGVGLYVATDGERKALAHVGPPNPRELADVRSTTEILAPIAQATGGTVRRIGAGDAAEIPRMVTLAEATRFGGDDWIALKSTNATVLEGLVRVPLLGGFLGLAILLSVLALTWAREGR